MRRLLTCALSCALALASGFPASAATNGVAQPAPAFSVNSDFAGDDPVVPVPDQISQAALNAAIVAAAGQTGFASAAAVTTPAAQAASTSQAGTAANKAVTVALATQSETDAESAEAGTTAAFNAQPASPLSDMLMWSVPTVTRSHSSAAVAHGARGIDRLTAGFMLRTRALVSRITESAMHYIGTPYSFGGTSAAGFDCSGYVQRVFATVGIILPRAADQQFLVGRHVDRAHARRGDLVFFQTYAPGVSHVGIYLGNNEFIHSSSSRGVMVSSLQESYWAERFIGIERVVGNHGPRAANS